MALSRPLACSGCIIEVIERADQSTLRQLLSQQNVEFIDTYWAPSDSFTHFLDSHKFYPVLSVSAQNELNFEKQCTHSMLEQTLLPGKPPHIAMSVVLTAMLYTTSEFNALQILLESKLFDLSEPLVFHYYFSELNCWNILYADAAAIALLLDRGSAVEDPNSFLLLKTLQRNSLLKPEMKFRFIKTITNGINLVFEKMWAYSTNNALSLLLGIQSMPYYDSSRGFVIDDLESPMHDLRRIRSLVRALCHLGLLCPEPHICPNYFSTRKKFCEDQETHCKIKSTFCLLTLLEALFRLFDVRRFSAYSESIVNELICVQIENNEMCRELIFGLHNIEPSHFDAANRISRQLLALGLFRTPRGNPKRSWIRRCLFDDRFVLQMWWICSICGSQYELKFTDECPIITPLLAEFYDEPLSLQQLSRIEIRSSLGIYEFETRVKTLPLPPSLLTYVWEANEMLSDRSDTSKVENAPNACDS